MVGESGALVLGNKRGRVDGGGSGWSVVTPIPAGVVLSQRRFKRMYTQLSPECLGGVRYSPSQIGSSPFPRWSLSVLHPSSGVGDAFPCEGRTVSPDLSTGVQLSKGKQERKMFQTSRMGKSEPELKPDTDSR